MSNKPNNNRTNKKHAYEKAYEKTKSNSPIRGDAKFMYDKLNFKGQDVQWYKQSPIVADSAGSISYAYPIGYPLNLGGSTPNQIQVPAVAILRTMPTFGIAIDGKSPMNMAARLLYTYVRHANSGSRNYEAPDLMTYVLAMDSAYMMYAHFKRLYGMMNYYNAYNRYFPKDMIELLGFNYDDVSQHMADLHYTLNQFANRLNSLCTPKDMYLYDRHGVLFSNVFADANMQKAQTYIFQPDGYFYWSGVQTGGSALLYERIDWTNKLKYEDIVDTCEYIINNLLTNEDIGIMSGDILKSFGETGIRQLSHFDRDYVVSPTYSEEVLSQIHNSTIFNPDTGLDIIQDNGILLYKPWVEDIKDYTYMTDSDVVLDSGMINPTSDYNIEATRLVTTLFRNEDDGAQVDACGSEIICSIELYSGPGVNNDTGLITSNQINTVTPFNAAIVLPMLTSFDWAPIFRTFNSDLNFSMKLFGDVFNYTVIDSNVIFKLHENCLMSLLNVYGLYAKYNK